MMICITAKNLCRKEHISNLVARVKHSMWHNHDFSSTTEDIQSPNEIGNKPNKNGHKPHMQNMSKW